MKNFKITAKEDGKEYWISRAVAVVGIVVGVSEEGNIKSFLVSQRGPGCPDHVGSWACTCGYLDWDESAEEAIVRELYEEIGLEVNKSEPIMWTIVTDPNRDSRQNVVIRYLIGRPQEELEEFVKNINLDSLSRGGELGEVSNIKLVSITDINDFTWAFNHDKVIFEVYEDWNNMK